MMTLDETATVLAKAAAFDRRTVGRADVMAWHEVIACVELPDALEAVKRWYTTNRDWIMPSDVLALARDVIQERIRAKADKLLEAPEDSRPLTDRSAEIQAFVRSVRDGLPAGKPELIRRPRLATRPKRRTP